MVGVNKLIAYMVEEGEEWEGIDFPEGEEVVETASSSEPVSNANAAAAPPAASNATKNTESFTTTSKSADLHDQVPSVRLLAIQHGIDLSNVPGTGPKGITKGDLLKFIKNGGATQTVSTPAPVEQTKPVAAASVSAPPPAAKATAAPVSSTSKTPAPKATPTPLPQTTSPYNDIEITQMRNIIAKRLTESKTTIPHQYTSIACEMSNIINLRKQLKAKNIKVSVNDFIIKAVAMTLKANPNLNQVIAGNGAASVSESVDISVAVATDTGLITPIVKEANGLGLSEISSTVADLAGRAKEKKLRIFWWQNKIFREKNYFVRHQKKIFCEPPSPRTRRIHGRQFHHLKSRHVRNPRILSGH